MSDIILLAGLGFGDCGKGSVTDYLTNVTPINTVIRYNGGAQAAHSVVTPKGVQHTFAQFGSGTLACAKTHLSRYMLVNPLSLETEAEALEHLIGDPYPLLTIERDALVTNPFQVAANRIKEVQRGKNRHGSCGMGIGETVADSLEHPEMAIRMGDLQDPAVLRKKLRLSRDLKASQLRFQNHETLRKETSVLDPSNSLWTIFEASDAVAHCVHRFTEVARKLTLVDNTYLTDLLKEEGTILFEGAQGVLLDQDYGFHPYTTWSDTTFGNANKLLKEAGHTGGVKRLGLLRGYMTRHGAGPFPTEISEPEIATDAHNVYGKFQEGFRVGHFDTLLARYALEVIGGVDELVLTNLDKLGDNPKVCTHYQYEEQPCFSVKPKLGAPNFEGVLTRLLFNMKPVYDTLESRTALVQRIEADLKTKVSLCSYGPTCHDKLPTRYYLEKFK